ncbi:MAG: HDOD domain-containing protein [Desulfobacteraceae bacterium]|nr:HDOD domain-containing protein [Desulfobacteraceae bacterium]
MNQSTEGKGHAIQSPQPAIGDKERIILFNTGQVRAVSEKELLFKKRGPDRNIYYVLSGVLEVVSNEAFGEGFTFVPGDWISETSLLSVRGRVSSVVAKETAKVLGFSPTAFQSLSQGIQNSVLMSLHDAALARLELIRKQRDGSQRRANGLSRYIKRNLRKSHGRYEQSEIILNIVKNIPRLPLYITHLIELLTSEAASAKDVADLAKQDPALVVDILKTINSSRYGLQREISDISYAVTYLGFNEIYQIAVSRGLIKSMPDSEEFRNLLRHSLFLSYIIFELSQPCDPRQAPLMSTIALVHDIGDSVVLLLQKQNPKLSLLFDMLDPGKLGAMLLQQWNIPKGVCQAVEHQGLPSFSPPSDVPRETRLSVALLYIAHVVYDFIGNRRTDITDDPYLEDYLAFLKFRPRSIDQVAREFVLKGLKARAQRLPDFVRKQIALANHLVS